MSFQKIGACLGFGTWDLGFAAGEPDELSRLFLRPLDTGPDTTKISRDSLSSEARELTLIFSAIISKTNGNA